MIVLSDMAIDFSRCTHLLRWLFFVSITCRTKSIFTNNRFTQNSENRIAFLNIISCICPEAAMLQIGTREWRIFLSSFSCLQVFPSVMPDGNYLRKFSRLSPLCAYFFLWTQSHFFSKHLRCALAGIASLTSLFSGVFFFVLPKKKTQTLFIKAFFIWKNVLFW